MNAGLAVRKVELLLAVAHRALFGLERVLVVWLGAYAVLDGALSTGMLFAFLAYQEQFATRTSALIDKASELKLLKLQGERLADIVLSAPEGGGMLPLPHRVALTGAVELRDVWFAYSDLEPPVLRGLNLRIEAGDSVAIAGPSGCGKTTLLKLLLGVYTPSRGEILVDGVPLTRLGLQPWRAVVGTVLQEEPLFAGSIADNIAFFSPEPDPMRVMDCARLASVHDMGYATLVGDMGAALSGGQKQRILLARALYRQPRILLLDEATSALDVDRERLVNQAIATLNLTRVIVAHRPDTIASAQRVVTLLDGVVASDSRQAVAALSAASGPAQIGSVQPGA
jgi:ATP-binding cassette subfamily B protein RaxB